MSTETLAASEQNWATTLPVHQCRSMLHRKTFALSHKLAGHPLFALEALIDVAKAASKRPNDLYYDAGDVKVTDKWGRIPVPDRPVDQIIDRIENAGAWIIMKHVDIDPAYAAVLDEFAGFVRELSLPHERHLINNPEMLVLITSPNRVTSFHFDAEINFLVQIQGSKQVWVGDPNDRETVSDLDIERYYAGFRNAGTYKPGVEDRATRYHLQPGEAVHIPTHAAHWVKNDNNISISLSLNFELPASLYRHVCLANYCLRRLGMNPKPPGSGPVTDRLKAVAGGFAAGTHRAFKRARSIFKP